MTIKDADMFSQYQLKKQAWRKLHASIDQSTIEEIELNEAQWHCLHESSRVL